MITLKKKKTAEQIASLNSHRIRLENRLLSHETPQLFLETREAHQYTQQLLYPMYIPPHLARTHTRAHQAIFELCIHLFTTSLQNAVCKWIKGEGFTPIFPSPLPSPNVLGVYALCILHAP